MFGQFSERLFWDFYAICYDSISKLTPYQEMLEDVLDWSALRSDTRLLDAGCGSGNFLHLLLQKNVLPNQVTAIDASTAMMARAKRKCKDVRIQWERIDLDELLPYATESFDRIVCTNVIFAVKNPGMLLAEFERILNPSGVMVLTTLDPSFNTNRILAAHLRTLRNWRARIQFTSLMFPLTLATLFNLIMRRKNKKKVYHFFTSKGLKDLVLSVQLSNITLKQTYAKQTWIVSACKPVRNEHNLANALYK